MADGFSIIFTWAVQQFTWKDLWVAVYPQGMYLIITFVWNQLRWCGLCWADIVPGMGKSGQENDQSSLGIIFHRDIYDYEIYAGIDLLCSSGSLESLKWVCTIIRGWLIGSCCNILYVCFGLRRDVRLTFYVGTSLVPQLFDFCNSSDVMIATPNYRFMVVSVYDIDIFQRHTNCAWSQATFCNDYPITLQCYIQ